VPIGSGSGLEPDRGPGDGDHDGHGDSEDDGTDHGTTIASARCEDAKSV